MKRMLTVLLTLMLLAACTSCSVIRQITEKPEIPMVEHAAESAQPAQTPEAPPAPSPDAAEKVFSRGTWSGRTFVSAYADIRLTLPEENWVAMSGEEIAQAMQTGIELSGADLALEEMTNVTDMMAQNTETGESITLVYEKHTDFADAEEMTAEKYAQIIKKGLEEQEEIGYAAEVNGQTELCGNRYVRLEAEAEPFGLNQIYLIRAEGNRMICLILTAFGEEGTEELLTFFEE